MFPTSTQRKYWMFKNDEEIKNARIRCHDEFIQSQTIPPTVNPDDYFLTPEECDSMLAFFERKLVEFCSKFKPPMPKAVQATSVQYFKRFYLNNSVMDCHPKEILVTAAYLACKVEEFNVSISQFIANINGNKERATDIILNNELLLMKELNFHLTVHNPYRPVEGLLVDIKTRCTSLNIDPETLRNDIDIFLDQIHFTNASLMYAPSQIALASIIHAASKNGQSMDSYVMHTLFGENNEKLHTLVEAIRNIRVMVKNLGVCPPLSTIKTLSEKLEKCRNQENNPDSQAYKRKLKEMMDEEDNLGQYTKQQKYDHDEFPDVNPVLSPPVS